jgi:hypothetical protein
MKDPEAYIRNLERLEVKEYKARPQKKDGRQVTDSQGKKPKAFRKGK